MATIRIIDEATRLLDPVMFAYIQALVEKIWQYGDQQSSEQATLVLAALRELPAKDELGD